MAVLPLVSVVYVSTATTVFTSKDLAELLRYARDRNSREGISGMLLYRSGNFIQAVEGPALAIDDLLARIGRDKRHDGLITLLRQPATRRDFADWSMGFSDLTDPGVAQQPGYSDFLRRMDSGPMGMEDAAIALRLLERFKQNNR